MNLSQSRNYDLVMDMYRRDDYTRAIELDRGTMGAVLGCLREELSTEELEKVIENLNGKMNGFSIIRCKTCHNFFTLTAAEAKQFTQKNLEIPSKCKSCRYKKKTMLTDTKDPEMKSFKLHFTDGKSQVVKGKTIAEACKQYGVPIARLNQLDRHEAL